MEKLKMNCLVSSVDGQEEIRQTRCVDELRGWLPVDAVTRDGRPFLRWMEMPDVDLREPFFHQTVERLKEQEPVPRELLTDLDALLQLEKVTDSLRPTGFIFHGSRCGSTLVANACRALRGSLVIAEAQALDKIADQYLPANHQSKGAKILFNKLLLRGAVSALGQRRAGNEQYYFIKFAFFGILQYEKIKSIWRDVPGIFIYRDPVEVIVSNLKTWPQWMKLEDNLEQVASNIGVNIERLRSISPEECCARALGRLYAKAAELADSELMLVRYEELLPEKLLEIVKFFNVTPTPLDVEEIRRISKLYSKNQIPAQTFTRDADDKRASASPLAREMAARWVLEPFQCLNEKLRRSRRSA